MERHQIIHALSSHRHELTAMGVNSLSLFGSTARNEATEGSDVDLVVDFDRPVSLFEFVRLKQYLERLLGVSEVDLVMRDAIIRELKEEILREAIRAA
jgi:hypothetical protein